MIAVVIADDQRSVVASLAAIVSAEPDIEVVATAHTGAAAVDAVALHIPDVVLLDVRMPGGDGISALADMTQRHLLGVERTRAIVLTTFDLDEYVEAALRAGASGFLIKTMSFEQLDRVRQSGRSRRWRTCSGGHAQTTRPLSQQTSQDLKPVGPTTG